MADTDNDGTPEDNGNESHWRKLWRRPKAWYWFSIPLGGFLMFGGGIIFWGGIHTAMDLSNSLAFCTSCHEMDIVYEVYKQTVHYQIAKELPNAILGKIDTPEKFEAHRLEMAQSVWEGMRATNSRECRNCHSLESMNLEIQDRQAQRRHTLEWFEKKGETCIDCHEGIAHKLPEDY